MDPPRRLSAPDIGSIFFFQSILGFFEKKNLKQKFKMLSVVVDEAGVDEAGCGSLIGPLVAAAVVLPETFDATGLADSKKLSKKKRNALLESIRSEAKIGIGVVSLEEINTNSFGWARRTVFLRALDDLSHSATSIVVDGTHFFDGYQDIPHSCIAKADATHASVAAASIVAKCTRDSMVVAVCEEHPTLAAQFGWKTNMGYPTKAHKDALVSHGCSFFHRTSFAPCRSLRET